MSIGVVFWGNGGQYVWLKTFPPSCADYQEILGEPQPLAALKVLPLLLYIQLFYNQSIFHC